MPVSVMAAIAALPIVPEICMVCFVSRVSLDTMHILADPSHFHNNARVPSKSMYGAAHIKPGLLTALNKTNRSSHHGDFMMTNRV